MAPLRNHIVFYLNGKCHEVAGERAGWMLADYLRYDRGLTGTKIVCAEGDCGACTVLRHFPRPLRGGQGGVAFLPMNACIATVAQMDGSSIITVDALAEGEKLSPPQRSMMECHGSQCGFCTPGFVMALTGLVEKRLRRKDRGPVSAQEAKNALTGNLCRCTGYQPIVDAATALDIKQCASVEERFWSLAQERDLRKVLSSPVALEAGEFSFYAPRTLKEAAAYLKRHRDARILSAGTDLGVAHNKRKLRLTRVVSLHLIGALHEMKKTGKSRLKVGARVTLTELRQAVKSSVPEFARFLDLFASPQIKNVATLAGNVGNASPIADTPPFLLAANATVHLQGPRGKRLVALDQFYVAYRKTAMKVGEFITAIEFDVPRPGERLALYKISQRKDLDISAVNAAFRATWGKKGITNLRIAFGGVAATPLRLKKTERVLQGKALSAETLALAVATMHNEVTPLSDLRGSAAFRRVLCESLLLKFFHEHGEAP